MKLFTQEAFEKALRQSSPEHFAIIYAAVMEDRFERLYFAGKLFAFLKHFRPDLTKEMVNADSVELPTLRGDLFARGHRFVIIDQIDKMKKNMYKPFLQEVENLDKATTLLLLGETIPQDLYQALKGDIVVLDLTSEKPWDKKKRLTSEIVKMVHKEGKIIDALAVELLIDSVGLDLARLKSEIEKLIAFTEGKREIGKEDVRQMTTPTKEKSYWQIARDLILGEPVERGRIKDFTDWLIFAGQVRMQLIHMVKIAESLEKGEIPKIEGMREKELDLLIEANKRRRLSDYIALLNFLFESELDAKEEGAHPLHLFDSLVIKFEDQKGEHRGAALTT